MPEARLERDSGLPPRPFLVLRDRPAAMAGEPGLWSLHLARAQTSLTRLRLRAPGPGLPAHDPAALRLLSLLLLAAGVIMAGPDAWPRLRQAFLPSFGAGAAVSVALQGWVEPPAYTGLAPILLPHDGGTVQVPQGSRLNVSLTVWALQTPPLLGRWCREISHAGAGELAGERHTDPQRRAERFALLRPHRRVGYRRAGER